MPWSAHIYWTIEYSFKKRKNRKKPDVQAQVVVLANSWVKPEMKSDGLLEHELGHYLIGCLCALEFLKRVDSNRVPLSYNFAEYVKMVFNSTLREYVKLEKKYDDETEHRYGLQLTQTQLLKAGGVDAVDLPAYPRLPAGGIGQEGGETSAAATTQLSQVGRQRSKPQEYVTVHAPIVTCYLVEKSEIKKLPPRGIEPRTLRSSVLRSPN